MCSKEKGKRKKAKGKHSYGWDIIRFILLPFSFYLGEFANARTA
jgi:hypothetical protein